MTLTAEYSAAILDSLPTGIILFDNAFAILSVNPAAAAVFETPIEALLSQPASRVFATPESLQFLESAENNAHMLLDIQGKHLQVMVSDVMQNTTRIGRVALLLDVSHFKRLNENMTLFLQTVSHDLRSPLTAAKGFVDMLSMVGEVNERQAMMQEKILTSIIDMTNLVEKVLDAGRLDPEMGAYELRRETTDPGQVVEKVVSNLLAAAQKKNLRLQSQLHSGVPMMNLDEMMLERALVNLVENAVKYTPEGGEILVSAQVENNNLVLAVRDNGYGIPPEKLGTLFEKGSRIRRKEHKSVRGSGLGLFIVKNVAQQHNGEALIESTEGAGSTFKIVLPISGQNAIGAQG
ncbi:MAG: PAS domain-containing protein [Anaerolineae bacterium]|nr:PAS domain-containing protein [Anaerolineae bacterium]